jgi:hypothetical protein
VFILKKYIIIKYYITFYNYKILNFFSLFKIVEILDKFNIYNYGGLVPKRVELDLNIALKLSSQFTPILISLPEQGIYINHVFFLRGFLK